VRAERAFDLHRADQQLKVIDQTMAVAATIDAPIWLRGGWAVDFFLGELTRNHLDIDWFAWASDAARLDIELRRHGFQPLAGPPPEQQLDYVKASLDSSFALMARDADRRVVVAGGPWAGEPWPEGMLDAPEGRIGSLHCAIVSPLAQIEIKRMMPVWVPGRPRRSKDAADIALLEAAMRDRTDPAEPDGV
jgi:hypothetical protein